MIGNDQKEQIVQATDFVSLVGETVQLHEKGAGDWWGRCPFHEERTESFHVNANRGLYYCFGCEAKGDVIDFVMRRENLDFADALRWLADRAGIEIRETRGARRGPRRNRVLSCLEEAERRFSRNLLARRDPAGRCDRARAYLGGRSMGREVSLRWGLGFALGGQDLVNHLLDCGFSRAEIAAADLGVERGNGLRDRFFDRVMFPIRDEAGRTIGFGGRVMNDSKPKYLNSKDSGLFHKTKNLYALDRAKDSIIASGRALIVEGYTDAIALHEAGFANACAILGTALTHDHIRLLSRFKPREITSLLDGDAAGQRAAEKALAHLGETEAKLTCVVLPEGKDPAEYLEAYGPEALEAELAGAKDLALFVIDRKVAEAQGSAPGRRRRILGEACAALAPLKGNPIALERYSAYIADAFDASQEEVRRLIREAPVRRDDAGRPAAAFVDGDGPWETERAADAGVIAVEPLPDLGSLPPRQRRRIVLERQFLALLADDPQPFAPHAARIRALSWEDPRHGVIAAVLLDAPVGSSARDRLALARNADPMAPQILSGSEFDRSGEPWNERDASFVMDELELETLRAEARSLQAALKAQEIDDDRTGARALLERSAALRERIAMLESRVRHWTRG